MALAGWTTRAHTGLVPSWQGSSVAGISARTRRRHWGPSLLQRGPTVALAGAETGHPGAMLVCMRVPMCALLSNEHTLSWLKASHSNNRTPNPTGTDNSQQAPTLQQQLITSPSEALAYARANPTVLDLLGGQVASVEELDEGKINHVFTLGGPGGQKLLLKHAPPYVKSVGQSFQLTQQRLQVEVGGGRRPARMLASHACMQTGSKVTAGAALSGVTREARTLWKRLQAAALRMVHAHTPAHTPKVHVVDEAASVMVMEHVPFTKVGRCLAVAGHNHSLTCHFSWMMVDSW